ncbi:MAG: DNA polymerase/3'-5' exonuclease PolX [Deltaproteobacteria bacterium]|nr:DNA polymerase/3'-5' exonuclease PolX [Deltaproteobacteria bacterium]
MTKEDVIRTLEDIAVLLELSGENPFKSRAYQTAARNLEKFDLDFSDWMSQGKIFEIDGIGEAIGKKITEFWETGQLDYYDKLRASIPPGHLDMLKIGGLGPKKIHTLYQELGIATVGELEYACHENRLAALKGFGKKTQENILAGIERLKHYQARRLSDEAADEAQILLEILQKSQDVTQVTIAGSLRRGNETVKDIDLLASSPRPEDLARAFAGQDRVDAVSALGATKVSVVLKSGINCDLRIVSAAEFPYALHHFTGSREHNTAMRSRAKDRGLKMNEYGLFKGEANVVCRTEDQIFAALGLSFIPPELRENMGEIEAAEKGDLPRLVEEADIRGLFHIHTNASDGQDPLERLILSARALGMQYIGISDHSRSAYYAGGLKIEAIEKQHTLVDDLNKKHAPFHVFKGIESDILPDGSLDYDEETLAKFDFVIAAIHSQFNMSAEEMTARIVKALQNPFTTMLAHPTGRLLLSREPYAVHIMDVLDAAARFGKVLELNANPHRLDLDWRHCIIAKKRNVKIAVNPDAHQTAGLSHFRLGIKIARKGWLEKDDCLNCLSLKDMKAYLRREA